jgi:hypothetical protein
MRVMSLGHKADHSPPTSGEVKNAEAIPAFPHTSLWCGVYVIKHRDNFTYTNNKEWENPSYGHIQMRQPA